DEGGGVTRVIEDGRVFERGGVNFSRVQGSCLPPSATAARPQLAGQAYDAMGVSLVLHPRNPFCPTVHLNVRFFLSKSEQPVWWFGGGMDLTPYYGFEDDARHFHAACRDALAPFGAAYYPRFKRECDEYFQLRYRRVPRGATTGNPSPARRKKSSTPTSSGPESGSRNQGQTTFAGAEGVISDPLETGFGNLRAVEH